ncbi:MAG: internal scaffolding protein [Arizlama microvirus]|nr:MAG: internal scaffolding protein [Arizlama microvirus]
MDRIEVSPYVMSKRMGDIVFDSKKDPGAVSITKQSFASELNINNIIDRFLKTGVIDPLLVNQRSAVFADVSDIGDYQTCLNKINAVKAEFELLPADVRNKFDNDPAKLLDFVVDPANKAVSIEMGLLPKDDTVAAATEAPPAPVIPPAK